MKKNIDKYIDAYLKIINEDINITEFKDITEAQETILFIDFLRKKHMDIPASVEKNYEDAVNYLKEHADEVEQMQKEIALNPTIVKDMDEDDEFIDDETVEEDVSGKDAFLSKIYDLIDTVYQIGVEAGKTGEELNPHEDEDVNDILGSIEADYDDGKPIKENTNDSAVVNEWEDDEWEDDDDCGLSPEEFEYAMSKARFEPGKKSKKDTDNFEEPNENNNSEMKIKYGEFEDPDKDQFI